MSATPIGRHKQAEPTAELQVVTPQMAAAWLESNEGNRNVRKVKVNTYAKSMRAGDWVITGEGVKFDWNGRLFDGQHRLLAVVQAKTAVPMFVFRELDPNAQTVVDTGAKRSPADALKFAGVEHYTNELAAIAKIMTIWDEGGFTRSGASHGSGEVTSTEVIDWIATGDNHARAVEAVLLAKRVNKSLFPIPSTSTLAAVLIIFGRVDEEGARQFAEDMADLRLNGKGDPLFTLHSRLTRAKVSKEVLRTPGQLFCYIRTWNARRAGEQLFQLKVGKVGGGDGRVVDITIPAVSA